MKSLRSDTATDSTPILYVPHLEAWLASRSEAGGRLSKLLETHPGKRLSANGWVGELMAGHPIGSAALSRYWEDSESQGRTWLNVTGVHLVADLNAVWATPSSIEPDRPSRVAFEGLCAQYGHALIEFGERRYVRLDAGTEEADFVHPGALGGLSLDELLPKGRGATHWISIITESQILCRELSRQGHQPGCEGLWFWGFGQLSDGDRYLPRVQMCAATSTDCLGLAKWLGLDYEQTVPSRWDLLGCGGFCEWPGDEQMGAVENMMTLELWLQPYWRKLRWGWAPPLEVASQERRWRIGPSMLWRMKG